MLPRKVRIVLQFLPSVFIFCGTIILIYFCITNGFMGLFYAKMYITGTLIWFIFSIFFILWIVAFAVLLFEDPGSMEFVMKYYKAPKSYPVCPKCGMIKPYRAHHCSTCNKCFAYMDHHCTVFGVCIAIRNRKVFIQYLVYSIVMLLIYATTCFIAMFVNEFDVFPMFLVMNIFTGLSIALFLGIFLYNQVKTLLKGKTLLEEILQRDFNDGLTKYERFIAVFGPSLRGWLLPFPLPFPEGNPFRWEKYRPKNDQNTDEHQNQKPKND